MKIEEIMIPAKLAMKDLDYGRAVTLGSSYGQLISMIKTRDFEIERLRGALSFYEREDSHKPDQYGETMLEIDVGERARQTPEGKRDG
ncbi:hypothetical protein [Sporosarcina sp. E16_8]|uniref:hypothetical protein n=1 Tax=Sporosarcina sp. E16_8 TaxID=2789295 RepID=UPI001A92B1ED|nr:hypothetical protein [Sporosarcina sp. E16_8]MBO0586139.1 hypothetical protein [Sporosarcina sp. E16_8]